MWLLLIIVGYFTRLSTANTPSLTQGSSTIAENPCDHLLKRVAELEDENIKLQENIEAIVHLKTQHMLLQTAHDPVICPCPCPDEVLAPYFGQITGPAPVPYDVPSPIFDPFDAPSAFPVEVPVPLVLGPSPGEVVAPDSISITGLASVPAPIPAPIPARIPARIPAQIPAQIPAPIPAPIHEPIPAPIPAPVTDTAIAPVHAPVPYTVPSPTFSPLNIPSQVPPVPAAYIPVSVPSVSPESTQRCDIQDGRTLGATLESGVLVVSSPTECCEACQDVDRCVAWLFDSSLGECKLRKTVSRIGEAQGKYKYGYRIEEDVSEATQALNSSEVQSC